MCTGIHTVLHACEIHAIDFSTVGRNLEKHILFVPPDLWRNDWTVMVGSVYIHVFLCVMVFVMPLAICLSYFLDLVFIAVFVELHFTWVIIQNSVRTSSLSLVNINLIYYVMSLIIIISHILFHYFDLQWSLHLWNQVNAQVANIQKVWPFATPTCFGILVPTSGILHFKFKNF